MGFIQRTECGKLELVSPFAEDGTFRMVLELRLLLLQIGIRTSAAKSPIAGFETCLDLSALVIWDDLAMVNASMAFPPIHARLI